MEDGCEADLSNLEVRYAERAGPLPETKVGGVLVWDLRDSRHVVVPDGVEKIGNYWFWDSGIESVVIPASVKEIEVGAFC